MRYLNEVIIVKKSYFSIKYAIHITDKIFKIKDPI